MTPPAMISAQPYQIRCAEIWGGTVSRQDQVATPGVRAAIHSSASGASLLEGENVGNAGAAGAEAAIVAEGGFKR